MSQEWLQRLTKAALIEMILNQQAQFRELQVDINELQARVAASKPAISL